MPKIGTARASLRQDPAVADRLLEELETDIENTLTEIRRTVYYLRPLVQDQLGLFGAIEAFAAEIEGQPEAESIYKGAGGLRITVQAPK